MERSALGLFGEVPDGEGQAAARFGHFDDGLLVGGGEVLRVEGGLENDGEVGVRRRVQMAVHDSRRDGGLGGREAAQASEILRIAGGDERDIAIARCGGRSSEHIDEAVGAGGESQIETLAAGRGVGVGVDGGELPEDQRLRAVGLFEQEGLEGVAQVEFAEQPRVAELFEQRGHGGIGGLDRAVAPHDAPVLQAARLVVGREDEEEVLGDALLLVVELGLRVELRLEHLLRGRMRLEARHHAVLDGMALQVDAAFGQPDGAII